MMKKIVLTGGAIALLSSMTVGGPLLSYARCGTEWLCNSASESVPLEWELKRARQMIADLKPEIEVNAKRIAREKIEVARLEKQMSDSDQRLVKAQSDIQRLTEDLRSENSSYTYGGRTYTVSQVKSDLGSRFKRFKTRQATVDKYRDMLTAREGSLKSAHQRMDAMLSAKRQLEVEVENLQARLGALRVAQTSSQLSLDDSQLSQTRGLLDEIATRIDVEEETMEIDAEYFGTGEIDLDEPSDETLLDDIAVYFGSDRESSLVAIQLD